MFGKWLLSAGFKLLSPPRCVVNDLGGKLTSSSLLLPFNFPSSPGENEYFSPRYDPPPVLVSRRCAPLPVFISHTTSDQLEERKKNHDLNFSHIFFGGPFMQEGGVVGGGRKWSGGLEKGSILTEVDCYVHNFTCAEHQKRLRHNAAWCYLHLGAFSAAFPSALSIWRTVFGAIGTDFLVQKPGNTLFF